ncbi:pseudouridylate synthase [Acinetobacter indicus]|uniref:pseudouridine synthase n=1 Tax=Acinetobacter indicus TaxID=756892 RepID=UPI002574A617|nr:pseudouridine synthase [Acinetobacter indicus]MDM1268910.1 pseudouridylate synthase [Acinetobacter indicus]
MSSTADFIPPMINGVSASKVYLQPSSARTVYAYLCQQFPHISAAEWLSRFQDGLVYDAHGQRLHIDSPFQAHTHCFYYRFLAHEVTVPFQHKILFENEDLLVVDKPHFLTMSPTGQYVQQTLLVRLKQQTGNEQLTPIHRLDRETAGVVLFSKQPASRGLYQQMFAERQVRKTYHAIAAFRADLSFPCTTRYRMEKGQPFYTMQVVDGVPNSETAIDLLEHNGHLAKYLLKPVTGKQHQLRVHLNQLGIAILNDPFYPQVQHKAEDDFSAPLQLLAKDICFQDPISKATMAFSSQFDLTL